MRPPSRLVMLFDIGAESVLDDRLKLPPLSLGDLSDRRQHVPIHLCGEFLTDDSHDVSLKSRKWHIGAYQEASRCIKKMSMP